MQASSEYSSNQTYDISAVQDPNELEYRSPSNFGYTAQKMSPITKIQSTPIRYDLQEDIRDSNT